MERERQRLPEWARSLSTRTLTVIENEGLPDMERDRIRNLGELYWIRAPGLGRKGVDELGAALGGWPPETEGIDLHRLRWDVQAIQEAVGRIAAQLNRLVT
jgi:hypothetical protein